MARPRLPSSSWSPTPGLRLVTTGGKCYRLWARPWRLATPGWVTRWSVSSTSWARMTGSTAKSWRRGRAHGWPSRSLMPSPPWPAPGLISRLTTSRLSLPSLTIIAGLFLVTSIYGIISYSLILFPCFRPDMLADVDTMSGDCQSNKYFLPWESRVMIMTKF